MYSGDKVYATFNNVTIGIDAVIFVEIYETDPTNASQNLAYKGNSKIFTVKEGENNVKFDLEKVQNQEVKQEFTVTFDANGGSFADGSQTQQITVQEGTQATAPKTEPTYQGRIFDFWATRQDDGGFSQYEFSQPVTENLTLYAQWRAQDQVASVKFDPATSTVDYDTGIALSCDTADATIYYTIDGRVPTTSSNRYTSNPITITTQTTIKAYAVKSGMTPSSVIEMTYSLNQYTVQFELNGGSFTESGKETPLTVTSGETVTLTDYVPTKSGFNFGGWYYDASLQQGADSSVAPKKDNTTSGTLTLYAKWEAQEQVASVKFNPATGPVDTGTTVTLSCDTAEAIIYYTTDGRAPTTSSNRYTSTPITITAETTIKAYAVKSGMTDSDVTEMTYSLNQYTVQFVLNGGSFTDGKTDSVSVTSGNSVNLTTYQPQYAGHTFGGWYYDAAFKTPVDNSDIVTPTQANITLYAKWEAVNNSITSFADLKSAITSASETIHVAGNIEISETLTIGSTTTLIADEPTTFTRATGFTTGALFTNSADFTLQGSENAIITINGNDIEASAPAIKSTANLTVTYCDFVNNTNTATDGGAIFVETTETMNFSASNCNFTNNKVTVSVTAGGAVAIDGSKVNSTITKSKFINNLAENNGGGALYISGSSTPNYLHTISDSQFNDNKTEIPSSNYGGAIYLRQGSLELNNISMNDNRHYSSEDSYSSSDIFIYRNYTYVTLCGTIIINSLVDNFGSGTDNPVIKLENFSTESQIGVLCTAGSGASVDDGDPLITPNDGEVLTSDQIACFTSIVDSSGKQYTLNVDGTITPNN